MKFYFMLAILCTKVLSAFDPSANPYEELEEVLPFVRQGWYINGEPMEKLIESRDVKVVIELGSWLGLSTRHIAKCLPDGGKVYAVDHWLGSAENFVHHRKFLPTLYEQFLSNVIHEELTHIIVPIRMPTLDAVSYFNDNQVVPDLIYVDAGHDEESVYHDLKAYFPLVKGHGVMCGDDWGWGHDLPVQKAVKRFAKENNLKITTPNNWFWILHEKKRGRN